MKSLGLLLRMVNWAVVLACAFPALAEVRLKGDHFQAALSSQTGELLSIAREGGPNLLLRPVAISIRDEVSGKVQALTMPIERLEGKASEAVFAQSTPDLDIKTNFVAGRDLSIVIKLRNKLAERRDVSVWFDFGGLPPDCHAFLPGVFPHPLRTSTRELIYGYRASGLPLVIPAVTFFSHAAGMGLTLLSPLAAPVQGFQVRLPSSTGPKVGRTDLRIEPQGGVQTEIFLDLHDADWRPGLAFIRDKYPEHFTAHNPTAVEINGPFLWSPTAPEEQVRQWHEQGVRWVEVHFTYPFLGKYFPENPRWVPAMDDFWAFEKTRQAPDAPAWDAPFEPISHYLEKVLTPWETGEKVRAFIRLLHQYNIKALMYFQPSECWDRYAAEHFMTDAVHDAAGALVPAWYEDTVLNPRPGSKWALYLEQQFKQLLAFYPEADGIFEDQSHYDILDYAHDDGFSIDSGKTADRMGYNICLLTSKLGDYAHSLGKTVWWNGPYQIELGAIGDGHLAEGSDEQIQWLGIGNVPITSGAWFPDLYDRVLLMGSQPAAPSLTPISFPYRYEREIPADAKVPPEQLRDFTRYAPLFDQIRQREWVLAADAVRVPPDLEANIFRKPDGNYAVPVVTTWGGPSTGVWHDLPVMVRVPDSEAIRGVYVLSADLPGWFLAHWKREGRALAIQIPRHHRASLILLAKTGFFATLRGDGTLVEGHETAPTLILDNWRAKEVSGEIHVGDSTESFHLAPGASQPLTVPLATLKTTGKNQVGFPVRVSFRDQRDGVAFQQQFVNVPVLEAEWEGTLRGYSDVTGAANLSLQNHGKTALQVSLRAEGERLQVTGLPAILRVPAGGRMTVRGNIKPAKAGEAELHLYASAAARESNLTLRFPVWQTRFSSRADVVSGAIEFEELVADGMPDLLHGGEDVFAPFPGPGFGSNLQKPPSIKPREVVIDGQSIGYLPSLNQTRWRGMAVAIPQGRLLELGRSFQVNFLPSDATDAYRLRKIRVVFNLTDGEELSSPVSDREYNTLPPGQGAAQPIRLQMSLPVE
ncbi:MAG: hypothetical protein ABSG32_04270 [Terriglobia bacterium]|jgi:hypothetical protein